MDMEIFRGENNEAFVAVSRDLDKEAAVRIANKHFKVKTESLYCVEGYVDGDSLYLEPTEGTDIVWVVRKKKRNRLEDLVNENNN